MMLKFFLFVSFYSVSLCNLEKKLSAVSYQPSAWFYMLKTDG